MNLLMIWKNIQTDISTKKHHNLGLGQEYLLVNRAGFGLYELNSVDYSNGIIQMIFTSSATGNTIKINLDVCNEHPDMYLINWKDVEDLVFTERNFDCADNELLEIEDE